MATFDQDVWKKLNSTLYKSLESATVYCKLRGTPYVELAHWLHQLHQQPDNDLRRILAYCQVDPADLDRDLFEAISALPSGSSSVASMSDHVISSVGKAWFYASLTMNDSSIRSAWLIGSLLQQPELKQILLRISPIFSIISALDLNAVLPGIVHGSPESHEASYDGLSASMSAPGEHSGAIGAGSSNKSALEQFCSDMTEQARLGKIDPVIGRSHEIRTMTDILLRRRQNNPLLTGEAGVGKTAVVEGLALAIVEGEVPPSLQDVRLLNLDVGSLLAGASMKGEFESRLKSLIEEASKSPTPVILFIDEIHTLIGAGGQAGTGDAANLLKPALARGNLRTIGATTWAEYKKHIEKDPALTRRFQMIQIHEPSSDNAINMVRAISSIFATHHDVLVLDEAIQAAVNLSSRYIPSRQLPDKAISLLDTACSRVSMSLHNPPARVAYLRQSLASKILEQEINEQELKLTGSGSKANLEKIVEEITELNKELSAAEIHWTKERELVAQIQAIRTQLTAPESTEDADSQEQPAINTETLRNELIRLEQELAGHQADAPFVRAQVNTSVIADIVSDWTGIPLGKMLQDEVDSILNLHITLQNRVIGQDNALQHLAQRIKTARSGLLDPKKPVGVFLLVGPSGIGKTETALALAEGLYGGEQNLITINMSEYQEAHTVSSLKGAPPGYVGYGEGGVLTEAVRRKPYSVILLDEVEKAHPDVHEIFYQVFDKGWMEDGEGRQIDFKNTVILLTSNTGSEVIDLLCDDPDLIPEEKALQEALQPELRKVFPAAFLGRLVVVPYLPLANDKLNDIVRLHLQKIVKRMLETQEIHLEYSDEVVEHIVEKCGTHETGVRHLIHYIEQQLLPELSHYWFQALSTKQVIHRILISMSEDRHAVEYQVVHQGNG